MNHMSRALDHTYQLCHVPYLYHIPPYHNPASCYRAWMSVAPPLNTHRAGLLGEKPVVGSQSRPAARTPCHRCCHHSYPHTVVMGHCCTLMQAGQVRLAMQNHLQLHIGDGNSPMLRSFGNASELHGGRILLAVGLALLAALSFSVDTAPVSLATSENFVPERELNINSEPPYKHRMKY